MLIPHITTNLEDLPNPDLVERDDFPYHPEAIRLILTIRCYMGSRLACHVCQMITAPP